MILDEIVEKRKVRLEKQMKEFSLEWIKECAYTTRIKKNFPFEQALRKKGIQFICEVKKASPSKGIIANKFNCVKIATEYEKAGASAISVLTEPDFF